MEGAGFEVTEAREFGAKLRKLRMQADMMRRKLATKVNLNKLSVYLRGLSGRVLLTSLATALIVALLWSFSPSGQDSGTVYGQVGYGGGSGEPTEPSVVSGSELVNLAPLLDAQGKATKHIILTSSDDQSIIDIPRSTQILDAEGNPVASIQIVGLSTPPPPSGYKMIGGAYDCLPDGTTFSPSITLTLTFKEADVPAGTHEEDSALAYWDGDKWVFLESSVNTVYNKISAEVAHFTPFAIFVKLPPPPPEPAAFRIGSLAISPGEVDIGKTVTIEATVSNTGASSGTFDVILKINDELVTHEEVTVLPGASQEVTFTTSKRTAGTYTVNVIGQTGMFVVKGPPAPPPPKPAPAPVPPPTPTPLPAPTPLPPAAPTAIAWTVISAIIAGVIIIGIVIWQVLIRRRV